MISIVLSLFLLAAFVVALERHREVQRMRSQVDDLAFFASLDCDASVGGSPRKMVPSDIEALDRLSRRIGETWAPDSQYSAWKRACDMLGIRDWR